jgi:hypothetical protein
MVMNVSAVYVCGYHKSVFAFREREYELPPYLIGFFGRNFAGFEALSDMISENIVTALTAPCYMFILSLRKNELVVGNAGFALVRSDEPPAVCFTRIFNIIYDGGDYRNLTCVLLNMKRFYPSRRHDTSRPLHSR